MRYQQVQKTFRNTPRAPQLEILSVKGRSGSHTRKYSDGPGFTLPLLLVAAGAMLVCGFYLAPPMLLNPLSQVWQAQRWSKTQCRIESVEMSRQGNVSFKPKVNYSYSINGRAFRGSQFQFNNSSWLLTKAQADSFVNTYSAGHYFPCFVNPLDLEKSVIKRSITSTLLFELLIIGTLLGLPLVLLLKLPYRFAEKTSHCIVESHLMRELKLFQTRLANISNSGQFWKFPIEVIKGTWLFLLLSPWILRNLIILGLLTCYVSWMISIAIG